MKLVTASIRRKALLLLGAFILGGAVLNTDGVLVDGSGKVVLRQGQRVSVQATLTHGDGDTPCAYTDILSVSTFESLPAASSAR